MRQQCYDCKGMTDIEDLTPIEVEVYGQQAYAQVCPQCRDGRKAATDLGILRNAGFRKEGG